MTREESKRLLSVLDRHADTVPLRLVLDLAEALNIGNFLPAKGNKFSKTEKSA